MTHNASPFSPADIPAVIAFWRTQQGIGLNESDEPAPLARFLARNPNMSLIARDPAGRVIAAILCGHDGRRGYLHHLAVAPEHRRQGLATALVTRCLQSLAAAGIPKCNIFLFDDNDSGRQFWQKLAYRPVNWNVMQRVISP